MDGASSRTMTACSSWPHFSVDRPPREAPVAAAQSDGRVRGTRNEESAARDDAIRNGNTSARHHGVGHGGNGGMRGLGGVS